ncbi:MAG: GIY-YIG nuclease family protein [Panacagrimonas sp.]
MKSLTLKNLLQIEMASLATLPALDQIVVCRHVAKKSTVLQAQFRYDETLLNAYQSEQLKDVFGNRTVLAFVPEGGGTRSLFMGAFANRGVVTQERYLELFPGNPLTQFTGYENSAVPENVFYELVPSPLLEVYRKRLVIDWGKAMLSWCQARLEKPVLEIRAREGVTPFTEYDEVCVPFPELKVIMKDPAGHALWHDKLNGKQGVYLILDQKTGQQYVGSATGKNGLLSRWIDYARTDGHGGNAKLKQRMTESPGSQNRFLFSILKVFEGTALKSQVLECEKRMKARLGSRVSGLNAN